jgi:hypothetical protein
MINNKRYKLNQSFVFGVARGFLPPKLLLEYFDFLLYPFGLLNLVSESMNPALPSTDVDIGLVRTL